MSQICIIKIDIQKVYNTTDRDLVINMMKGLGFPDKFNEWMRTCTMYPHCIFFYGLQWKFTWLLQNWKRIKARKPDFSVALCDWNTISLKNPGSGRY